METLKLLRVEDAVGKRLAMDYTIVTPDQKGALKRRGEVLEARDVEVMKANGHYYVYVLEGEEESTEEVFETDAAVSLASSITSGNLVVEASEEGKALVRAGEDGLFIVNSEGLRVVNESGLLVVIARRSGVFVRRGDVVAVVDVVPLKVPRAVLEDLLNKTRSYNPVLALIPSARPRVGVLVVGTEIVEGLKRDIASGIIVKKLAEYNCSPGRVLYARDDEKEIAHKIEELLEDSDAVIAVGGMSVDPTDRTPVAIRMVADTVVAYGIPMKPTTMSMVAYKGDKAIIGVSSGIIHFPDLNFLDVILPWVSSKTRVPREHIVRLGEGGLTDYYLEKMKKRIRR
ncbi:molybdopterin-binding protein [Thermogladius sp.]|uniref:molybdopterin-binding protein n=1 Tax=Thermogladius sp. TaxID=2023064 RepID=UPI003D102733